MQAEGPAAAPDSAARKKRDKKRGIGTRGVPVQVWAVLSFRSFIRTHSLFAFRDPLSFACPISLREALSHISLLDTFASATTPTPFPEIRVDANSLSHIGSKYRRKMSHSPAVCVEVEIDESQTIQKCWILMTLRERDMRNSRRLTDCQLTFQYSLSRDM